MRSQSSAVDMHADFVATAENLLPHQRKLMALLPVDEVWGVGRRISKKLEALII